MNEEPSLPLLFNSNPYHWINSTHFLLGTVIDEAFFLSQFRTPAARGHWFISRSCERTMIVLNKSLSVRFYKFVLFSSQ